MYPISNVPLGLHGLGTSGQETRISTVTQHNKGLLCNMRMTILLLIGVLQCWPSCVVASCIN